MDKAQEKIRQDLIDSHLWFADGDLKFLAQYLAELGYRKIKDKPPLLSDKEVADWLYGKPLDKDYELLKREAQREADIKHYEGK